MADNTPIIDFGNAPRDLQLLIDRLKLADGIIVKISQDALTAGRNLSSIQLPSDLAQFTQQNAQLTAQIQAQAAALATLQTQYNNLNRQRQQGSQRTAEEAVNQAALNRNALEQARINSRLIGEYAQLNAQHTLAARKLQDLIIRGRQVGQSTREYNREISNARREFTELNTRIIAADRAVGRFNRNVGNYPQAVMKGLKDLIGAFGIVGGIQLFAGIVKDIFATTKEIQSLDMALKQVTQTNAQFAESQAFLSRISEAYGVNINDLTKQFTQFYVSAKDKISGREIEQIFESITKAGSAMGLSQQQQERAFLALNQMMSKGTIQAEELRGQLGEALPGALGIMAKSLGVTEKQLGQMMKDGQLLSSEVLPKFAKQLEITYGIEQVKRIETLTASQNRLSNSWIEFVRTLNDSESGGITSFFSKILEGVNWLLQGLVQINQSLKSIRTEFINEATSSTLDYLNAVEKVSEREALANLTRKDAIKNIGELNEKLSQLKHEYELLNAVKPLNFLPSRMSRLSDVTKEIEEINASLGTQKGRMLGAQQALDQLKPEKAVQKQTELTKAQLKAIEDALKAQYDAAKKELELQLLKQEVILNGELESYDNQYKALEKFLDLKLQIIKIDYNEQVRLAKGNKDKIRSAEIEAEMATIKIMQDSYSKVKTIRKKQNDEQIQEIKDIEAFLKDYHEEKDALQEKSQEIENKALESSFALIDKKIEKLKELKLATKDYTDSFIEEFASGSGLTETFSTFIKQFDDGTGKMTTKFKQLLEGADSPLKKFQVYFNSISQSAQEAFNLITEMSEKNFEGEKTRLQAQYDIAVGFAGENAAAKKKLDEDLEKRQKEIALREAKAKKKQALYNIAIDTSQAVVSALPNLILAGIIAALGIAQAVAVSSQEIPQYWMGGTHDGGLMMVNDGKGSNYKETVITPDGNIHRPQGRNVIMDAPAGTKIFTHDQFNESLYDMMKGNGINMSMPQQQYSGISKDDMREAMFEAFEQQPQHHTNISEEGITTLLVKKGNVTKTISQRGNSTKVVFKR